MLNGMQQSISSAFFHKGQHVHVELFHTGQGTPDGTMLGSRLLRVETWMDNEPVHDIREVVLDGGGQAAFAAWCRQVASYLEPSRWRWR